MYETCILEGATELTMKRTVRTFFSESVFTHFLGEIQNGLYS